MYYICVICVLYMFLLAFLGFFASAAFFVCVFAGFIWFFLGFLRPRRFLYVLLLAFAGFSCFFCVRGDSCMCFCWLLLAFLGLFASAAIFVCVFAGFCWLFLGFWHKCHIYQINQINQIKINDIRTNQFSHRGGGPQDYLNPTAGGQKGGTRYNLTACWPRWGRRISCIFYVFIRVRHAARAPPTPYCWKRSPRWI